MKVTGQWFGANCQNIGILLKVLKPDLLPIHCPYIFQYNGTLDTLGDLPLRRLPIKNALRKRQEMVRFLSSDSVENEVMR